MTGDYLLYRLEPKAVLNCTLTMEEHQVLEHFNTHHSRNTDGRFVAPISKQSVEAKLGESRSGRASIPYL